MKQTASNGRRLAVGFLALWLLSGLTQPTAAAAPTQPEIEPELLVEQLRKGGLVIYLRHAKTDKSQLDRDRNDLTLCSQQRNLSDEGRDQARGIGAAMRTLGIPTGVVISSPYCRCKETAQLAFGNLEVSDDLRFGMGTDREKTAHLTRALREMLATEPQGGGNTVLVSHTANLKEATGIWPDPEGAAYVFRPARGDGFEYLGRIGPEQWQRLVGQ